MSSLSSVKVYLKRRCAAKNCFKRTKSGERFFRFPKDTQRAKNWAIAAGRQDLLKKVDTLYNGYRICGAHFEKKFFLTPDCTRNRLLAQAQPTIFLHSEEEQPIIDHNYAVVETKRLQNMLSLQNEDSLTLEEMTTSSSDPNDLHLHHEIEIKTEPVSSTSFQTSDTVSTPSQKPVSTKDEEETSMKHQITYLMNDNFRLIQKIKQLDAQLEAKRNQILKTLSLDEFQEILKKYNDSEQQTELSESDDVEVKVEDVVVKVENASEWEDHNDVEDATDWDKLLVKVEDIAESEEISVKVEDLAELEDVAVKVEDTGNWEGEDIVKVEDIVKMETI